MAKIYGALEVAQLEWFTDAGKPAPASYIYRVIYVSDLKQVQVSDGTNWIAFLNTSTNQTLAGDITFTGAQIFSGQHRLSVTTNSSTGAIVALAATTPVIEFTGAVTSIAGIASGASGATVMLVNRSGNSFQVLDEGAGASASNRIRTGAGNITLANNASVLLTYVGDNRWHVVGGSGSGAGAGGAKNYYTVSSANSNFAQNTVSPWSAATLTLSSGVPTGTPTLTATQMAIATTATNPLLNSESLYNMQLTKSAANAQGQGFISGVLTIDREDVAKVLTGSFTYEVVSGTIDLSGASTQSLEIWVYNVTANQWIQPAGFRGMNQSSGVGQVTFTFQTDGTPANVQYRVAVITAQTSTSAYVVNFNDFKIGPQTIPTVQLRNPAGTIIATGSLTPPSGYLYCDGAVLNRADYAELFAAIGTSYNIGGETGTQFRLPDLRGIFARGAGTHGSLTTANGTAFSATLGQRQNDQLQGHRHSYYGVNNTGSGSSGFTILNTTNGPFTGGLLDPTTDGTNGTPRTGNETRPANQAVAYHICFSSGFVQTSNDTDTRVVAASAYFNGSLTVANNTDTNVTGYILGSDTHGAFNTTSGVYRIPVSGFYKLNCQTVFNLGTGTISAAYVTRVFRNNANIADLARFDSVPTVYNNAATVISGSKVFQFVAGDEITFRAFQNTGSSKTVSFHEVSIERLSGPSVIAASETVAAFGQTTAGLSIPNSAWTTVTTPTIVDSTHGALSTGGVFTAPASGRYLASCAINFGVNGTGGRGIRIRKNSGDTGMGNFATTNSTNIVGCTISGYLRLNAGDTVTMEAFQNSGGAVSLTTGGDVASTFSIVRVGN